MSAFDFTSMRTTSAATGRASISMKRTGMTRLNIDPPECRKIILTFMASPRSAAAVILVKGKEDPEVFWVRRAAGMAFQGGFWAFPGGQLDPDEDARICAARELFEEVRVRVDPAEMIEVGRWVTPA